VGRRLQIHASGCECRGLTRRLVSTTFNEHPPTLFPSAEFLLNCAAGGLRDALELAVPAGQTRARRPLCHQWSVIGPIRCCRDASATPRRANQRWSMDSCRMLHGGARFRTLTLADVFTRECRALFAETVRTRGHCLPHLADRLIVLTGREDQAGSRWSSRGRARWTRVFRGFSRPRVEGLGPPAAERVEASGWAATQQSHHLRPVVEADVKA